MSRPFTSYSLLIVLFFLTGFSIQAQSLKVDKVEPPNWWSGMKWNNVQLMLYGESLDGINARFEQPALRVEAVHTLPNASYAFVDVQISEDAPPGKYDLIVSKGKEERKVVYEIAARPDNSNSHRGFGVDDVLYLITPDRFANGDPSNDQLGTADPDFDPSVPEKRHGGDLKGIIDRLDYLADLGVTTLWINPVLENTAPGTYHGYAVTDLYKIDPRFGSNEDYRRLVQEAHKRGLKIVFDHVANHIGIEHEWLSNLPMESWLNGSVESHLTDKHYKLAISDPYAAPTSEAYLRGFWFVDGMPDLNQRNPYLSNYLIQNMIWWMEYSGLDGVREDTYPYNYQEFMTKWEKALLEEYPQTNIVGEIWAIEPAYLSLFQKASKLPRSFETNLPSIMDFPLMEAYRNYLKGEGLLRDVYSVLAQDFLYTDPDNILTFMDNHDTPRGIFVAKKDTAKIKQVMAMLLTSRGVPQFLYGTEINMYGGERHVELREDFPGGFPGHQRDAFQEEGRTAEENSVFQYFRQLLHLRKDHPALRRGQLIHYPLKWKEDIYKYFRILGEDQYLIIVNGHGETRTVDLSETTEVLGDRRDCEDLLSGRRLRLDIDNGISIDPHGVLLLKL
ncbi:MAG: alpha-amylase family glycosyl hydrolase [Bacteroidota bacterium]